MQNAYPTAMAAEHNITSRTTSRRAPYSPHEAEGADAGRDDPDLIERNVEYEQRRAPMQRHAVQYDTHTGPPHCISSLQFALLSFLVHNVHSSKTTSYFILFRHVPLACIATAISPVPQLVIQCRPRSMRHVQHSVPVRLLQLFIKFLLMTNN